MRILAIAYACDPTEGSEPGAGWMWSRLLARLGPTTVITRTNNKDGIEAELGRTPERDNLEFVYVDVPRGLGFWKKGQRGVRLYYLLWQRFARREARRANEAAAYDLVWHHTFATYWLGSIGGSIGPPFIFGPVGGGGAMCLKPWLVGWRGLLYEIVRALTRFLHHHLNPLVRGALKKADLILVNNEVTGARVGMPDKVEVFPNPLLEMVIEPAGSRESANIAMYAGRLLGWKGVAVAIKAIATLPEWELRIFGRGPDEERLRRLADELGVAARISFKGWVARAEIQKEMQSEASVFAFPSAHDDAPWVVGEAVAHGLPVVCLARGGTPAIAGVEGVALTDERTTVQLFARALADPPTVGRLDRWHLDVRERALRELLERRRLIG